MADMTKTPIDRIRIAAAELRTALLALPNGSEMESDVDELIRVARADQAETIRANLHNTPADHRKADAASEALVEAREKFLAKWGDV